VQNVQDHRVRKPAAAIGSAIFFVVAPVVVAGMVPWWLTGWQPGRTWWPAQLIGAAITLVAAIVLMHSFARFVMEGRGTPAPVAPTEHLVIGGLYRFVRNPMYVAVVAGIAGQALILGRLNLWIYAAAAWLTMAVFVRLYEEPTLRARYGTDYDQYRQAVPAWLPRATRAGGRRHPGGS
jgi:protein-S-isoprenylcysteine O-methyltransferase Ste14